MQLDVHSNVQKTTLTGQGVLLLQNLAPFDVIYTGENLQNHSYTSTKKTAFLWLSFGQSMWWKCRTRRLKMAASQNKATIKLDSRDHWQKWTFHVTSCTHNSPTERRSVPSDQLQWFNSTNWCLIEGWMAIVEPNLHRLNRLRCFCWDPTRPEMNKILCTGYSVSRSGVIRHHPTPESNMTTAPRWLIFGTTGTFL